MTARFGVVACRKNSYLCGMTIHHAMKTQLLAGVMLCATSAATAAEVPYVGSAEMFGPYEPTEEVLQSRRDFSADRFGIFIHWGIYSMFGHGEWYLNYGPRADEYAKAAAAFYPVNFNAKEWTSAIRNSGARYICFTTRHHDGFSMFDTAESDYNIVDATPFRRDVLKELSDACREDSLSLHLYYSHIDWTRPDYPSGRTGLNTGRDPQLRDWPAYYEFMNRQLRELLTGYGPVRAIWFDGLWDHDQDAEPFNWQLEKQYALVHSLQPGCMVGNNHHLEPMPGEDIQIFERDLPGQNTAGLSGQQVGVLPLETCNTMNNMWGYRVADTDYKDSRTLIHYLVNTAGLGANLLLNIGPQPDGSLPEASLKRLRDIGQWLSRYGETIYGTDGAGFAAQPWGTATRLGNRVFVHVLKPGTKEILVPVGARVASAKTFDDGRKVAFRPTEGQGVVLTMSAPSPDVDDYIIELILK